MDKAHLLIEADARAWLASNLMLMEARACLLAPDLLLTGLLFCRWCEGAHLSDRRGMHGSVPVLNIHFVYSTLSGDEMLDIPSISAVVATIGVLVGVIFAFLEVRTLVKTNQTDLAFRLYSAFGNKEFQEAYEKISTMEVKNYRDLVKKGYRAEFYTIGSFFEGIGVLVKRKLIDVGLVDDLFRESIKFIWEKTKPVMEDYRKQFNEPLWGTSFEYLYNETKNREQRRLQTQQ